MKIVVHADSAFDLLYFNRWLKKEQWEVMGYFYNPQIHPSAEYNRQLLMQKLLGVLEDIIMIFPEYDFEHYLAGVAAFATQQERCRFCYRFILERTAAYAKQLNIPYFTSSWLIQPNHDHALLKEIGDEVAEKLGLKFLYSDFSKVWEEADQLAVKLNVYEPPYCGCIYSEKYHCYPMTLQETVPKTGSAKDKALAKPKRSAKSASRKK